VIIGDFFFRKNCLHIPGKQSETGYDI
jgi:hypothetical protein